MFHCIKNVLCACSSKNTLNLVEDIDINIDLLAWSMRLLKHPFGEFSMAAVQANEDMEAFSQLDIGNEVLFVGTYDGRDGISVSKYLKSNLLPALLYEIYLNDNNISEDILRKVVDKMEIKVTLDAKRQHVWEPQRAIASSSCLFSIISNGKLYVANVGDSRAVMGSLGVFGGLHVQQLVRDHNARNEHVKVELRRLHGDPDIVRYNRDAWRVAGVSEVSRCIGNAYLKRAAFTLHPYFEVPRTELAPSDFTRPLLSAEPEIYSRVLRDSDRFIIFASGGLWKFLTNEEAAQIVNTNPREGIAKRLVRIAIEKAASKQNITHFELLTIPSGERHDYHDDIVVTVVFLDKKPDVNLSVIPNVFTPRIHSFQSFSDMIFQSVLYFLPKFGKQS